MALSLHWLPLELLYHYVRQRQRLTLGITMTTLHCTMPAVMDTFR